MRVETLLAAFLNIFTTQNTQKAVLHVFCSPPGSFNIAQCLEVCLQGIGLNT